MILFASKHLAWRSALFNLFYILTFLIAVLLSPATLAEQGKKWTNEELLSFFTGYGGDDEFTAFLDNASKEDVNQAVILAYGQGERSLLSLVIELKENKELVTRLLAKGANPEGSANSVQIPLLTAIATEKWDIARLLLEAGANPSQIIHLDDEEVTLLYAVLKEKTLNPFVEIAIDFKPELLITEPMKEQKSYLELALENDLSLKVIRYFLTDYPDINKRLNSYGTPYEYFLVRAVFSYHREGNSKEFIARQQALLNFFLEQNIKEISPSSKGRTHCYNPLYVVRSNVELLNRLLAKGFDPNQSNCYQRSHVTVAAEFGYLAIFKALLDAGGEMSNDTIIKMIESDHSGEILRWVWQYKPDVFKQCEMSDCEDYIKKLIHSNRLNDDFAPMVETLLTRLSGDTKLLNRLLKRAIYKNNPRFADRLIAAGANPLDAECDCQQEFWTRSLYDATITWLIDHKVNPFAGDKPFHDVIELNNIPAKPLEALLKMASEQQLSEKNLHHWFTLLLDSLKNSSSEYNQLQQQLAVFKTYNVTINNVLDDKGKPYLPTLINALIGKQDNNDSQNIALIWLLAQGAKPTEENQSHYLDNAYLRALMDRAGQSETVAMQPENKEQAQALQQLIDDAPPYHINMLITAKILPENKAIGIKTMATLEAEGISDLLYACHYASHQVVWAWLQEEIDKDEEASKLFQVCTTTDLNIDDILQAPTAEERRQWFINKFREINFHVLELDSEQTVDHSNPNPNPDSNNKTKSQTLSAEESNQLQTLLAAQLKNVSKTSLDETQQTLTTLIQANLPLPDKALQTFVVGTDLMDTDHSAFMEVTKQLVVAGADPTLPLLEGSNDSFMIFLPLNEKGQAFYNELYSDLSLLQKIRLWNAYPTRLIASIRQQSTDQNRMLLLFFGVLLLFAELAAFVALLVYFVKINKQSVAKQLIPTWRLQSAFWAGMVLLALAIVNALTIDFFAYRFTEMVVLKDPRLDDSSFSLNVEFFQWTTWIAAWSLVMVMQMITLIILFTRTFIQKNYYAISFFTGFLLFVLTLSLPFLLIVIAEQHEYLIFPFYSSFMA